MNIVCAQSYIGLGIESGLSGNNNLIVGNEKVSGAHAVTLSLTSVFGYQFKNNVLLESSIFGQYIRSKGKIGNVEFLSRKLKFGLDLLSGYQISNHVNLLIGGTISNLPDLSEFNFRKPDNLRLDICIKSTFTVSKKISFHIKARTLINNISTRNLISDPKYSIQLGCNYLLKAT